MSTIRVLGPGVYGPLPTFFDKDGQIDFKSYEHHLLRLASLGVVPICMGSLGEASHLDTEERISIIRFVRQTLDDNEMSSRPIVAGVGGASTRETIRLAKDAAAAGADAGMVILPAYYAASLIADHEQVIQYYVDICEASPIPILLYNFPANAAGQDMSSDTIEAIIRRAPNLCGVKLTCPGSIPKLIRLSSAFHDSPELNTSRPQSFLFLDGLIADLVPWMHLNGHGTVSGIPNFAPFAGVRLFQLCSKGNGASAEEKEEMRRIQAVLGKADVAAVPGGVRAMSKSDADQQYALNKLHGCSPYPRRPLLPLAEEEGEAFLKILQPMLELDAEMEKHFA
ncbi:hypothetical protein L202_04410 [Cryptococcus amylolentus CBS 6039]|uniref:Dihydrodipicolinate synthase n=1 Tax=Cryptococcus amylolentus CBS 6039 TaxID=1295533 RepID=A0A1E3HRA4_9TREE|nr:hypothetical protein L202_04410 [Cryptococcus amylolentus CBS 6039]ODN78874.1 hypothetical protein L202_04410 [Cryptococcus amylolentus CBS 6039]